MKTSSTTAQSPTEREQRSQGICDVLILDAHLRQALVTIRSLGRRNLRVMAVAARDKVPAFASRWCAQYTVLDQQEGTSEYLAALLELVACVRPGVIIPCSDGTLALLKEKRALFPDTAIAIATDPALSMAINKDDTLRVAASLGIAIPEGVSIHTPEELERALQDYGLPAVIKPVESWVQQNEQIGARIVSRLVTTPEEARQALEDLSYQGRARVLYQAFLTGRREAVSVFYAQGEVAGCFAQWARRTEPPLGGQSVFRQSIPLPDDIAEQSKALVRELNLEGYAEVEYRRDERGKPYLMEINPRLSASVEIAVRAGVDFPYLLYLWALGKPLPQLSTYTTGIWMRHLGGDIMTTIAAIQERGRPGVPTPANSIRDFLTSFLQPTGYDYLDWQDMRPAFRATQTFLGNWLGNAIQKRWNRLTKGGQR